MTTCLSLLRGAEHIKAGACVLRRHKAAAAAGGADGRPCNPVLTPRAGAGQRPEGARVLPRCTSTRGPRRPEGWGSRLSAEGRRTVVKAQGLLWQPARFKGLSFTRCLPQHGTADSGQVPEASQGVPEVSSSLLGPWKNDTET